MLCLALATIWYITMRLAGWYSAGFHLTATFSSMIMVGTGNSWGVIEKIIR